MKKKVWFSLIIMILVLVLTFGMVSCNKKKKKNTTVKDTLVVGYDLFSNKFSPFFSETSYDQDVWSMTQIGLLAADRQGAIIYKGIDGETINYNGTNYTYYGLSNLTVTKVTEGADAGHVYYDITIRSGDKTVYFSDGQPVTIDDVLFSMYVLSDPTYDGASTFYSLPIKGMQSYRLDLDQEIIDVLAPKAAAIQAAYESTYEAYDAAIKALEDAFATTYADAIATYKTAIAAADAAYDAAVEAAEALTDEDAQAAALEAAEVACDNAYDAAETARNNTEVGGKKYSVAAEELDAQKQAVVVPAYTVQPGDIFTQAQYDAFVASIWTVGGAALAQDIVSYCVAKYGSYLADFNNSQVATGMGLWGFGDYGVRKATTDASVTAEEKKGTAYRTAAGGALYVIDDTAAKPVFELGGHKYVKATGDTTKTIYRITGTHVKNGAVTAVSEYTGALYVFADEDNFYTSPLKQKYSLADDANSPTIAVYAANIKAAYGDNFIEAAGVEKANGSYDSYMQEVANKWMQAEGAEQQGGRKIANIAGITKTGANSLRIETTKFDAVTVYQLSVAVAPKHYYGNGTYNYEQNNFGFTKGDLTPVRSKTTAPMGAGAYKFVSFADGIVTFEANANYWEGTPKIKYVKFKEYSSDSDKTPALLNGDIDIVTPSISNTVVDIIKGANNNGQLSGNQITTDLIDFNGYGYIGICSDVVNVAGNKGSEASKNLRKGFATLFAAYREYTVNSYYGDRASVINYPISNCSWAAPQPNDQGYAVAFSKDVDGNSIYTADMDETAKFAAAKQAAIGFFKAAGYTWNGTQFTDMPNTYEFWIPGGGSGDHPTLALANKVAEELASIGVTIKVKDLANSNDLWDALGAHTLAFWAAAWGGSSDPDMYQVYHSDNKTGSNHYGIADAQLDSIIMEARETDVVSTRKAYYKQALNIILDWGVEVPVYQRKECVIYSTDRVKIDTLTPDRTPYWSYLAELYKLEINA